MKMCLCQVQRAHIVWRHNRTKIWSWQSEPSAFLHCVLLCVVCLIHQISSFGERSSISVNEHSHIHMHCSQVHTPQMCRFMAHFCVGRLICHNVQIGPPIQGKLPCSVCCCAFCLFVHLLCLLLVLPECFIHSVDNNWVAIALHHTDKNMELLVRACSH